jgi:hypothetical protein
MTENPHHYIRPSILVMSPKTPEKILRNISHLEMIVKMTKQYPDYGALAKLISKLLR